MSAPPPNKPFTIDQAHLRRARNLARQNGRTVIAELEQLYSGTADELVQQLAVLFGMGVADTAGLAGMMPAFDLLPLAAARRWRCILLREADGTLVGVLADPFDPDLQLWLNKQARGAVLMRLISNAGLQAFLDSYPSGEPSLLASPVAAYGRDAHGRDGQGGEDRAVAHDEALAARVLDATRDLLQRAMRR